MLLRGSNSRSARGQSPNRSRGSSRGRGSTSRGASNSSGKSRPRIYSHIPYGPRVLQEARAGYHRSSSRGRNPNPDFTRRYSSFKYSGTSTTENSPNGFELERLKNATKREQLRPPNGATVNGRGGRGNPRGTFSNKQVRFADPLAGDKREDTPSKSPSPASLNPFASATTSSPFGTPATMLVNPFGTPKTETSTNLFGTPSPSSNPFGGPSQPFQPPATANVFGRPSGPPAAPSTPEALQKPSTNVFGAPPNPFGATLQTSSNFNSAALPKSSSGPPIANPFGAPSVGQPSASFTTPVGSPAFTFGSPASSTAALSRPSSKPPPTDPFGGASSNIKSSPFSVSLSEPPTLTFGSSGRSSSTTTSKPSSNSPNTNTFGAPSNSRLPTFSATSFGTPSSTIGSPTSSATASKSTSFGAKPARNGLIPNSATQPRHVPPGSSSATSPSSSALANRMDQLLRKEGIVPPAWPTSTPGDPKQKGAMEAFWQTSKGYRSKVRASLIGGGFLDDPDKPKKLSEAIDFKGTCEDMCPEFEKITRIVEHDVQAAEKELAPDGSMWPAPRKMVKALARSAAGQDAPLPMDVRSPAALRRTLDYLLLTVLGEEGDLSTVHGFLWDRTRAIRRDFVFQSSMSPTELADQVYCLERITRFHAIALHQMSREEVVAEDFSEQQEIEQLGKALLSLIHAYEDCQAQGITCNNEAEFRAYYVLFNSHNSGILETVQDWGWKFWGESNEVRTALSLVETLQNVWDTRGPLKPRSTTDVAQNGYSRFFSIVGDRKVSYTMACFAEIHFNNVRKSALKTILASYRKQRDQTKDWTLTKLNAYLRFDDEEEIIEFGEAYGLQFEENDGDTYLSFESEDVSDPFPPLKQRHSYSLVERKRGDHSLPAVIDATVYDEGEVSEEPSDEESLLLKDTSAKMKDTSPAVFPSPTVAVHEFVEESASEQSSSTPAFQSQPTPGIQTPTSPFSQSRAPQTSGPNFLAPKLAEPSTPVLSKEPRNAASNFSKPLVQESQSIFAPPPQLQTKPASQFSFLNQLFTQPVNESTKPPHTLEQHTVSVSHQQIESPKPFSFDSLPGSMTPPVDSPKSPFSLLQYQSTTSPPTHGLKPQFSLGDHSITPPKEPSVENAPEFPALGASSNPTKQTSLPRSTFETGPTFSHVQNPVFSGTPQVPAPLSKPPSNPPFQDKSAEGTSFITPTKPPAHRNRKVHLDNLAKWVTVSDGGIIDQFTEYRVEQIVRNAVGIYLKERADKLAKEEEDQAQQQADQFRFRSLATKYGHRWREAARRKWLRRRGREARKARQEMAETLRASKALQSANVVEEFRASMNGNRRGSLESLLNVTAVFNSVHDSTSEIREIVLKEEPEAPSNQRRQSDRSTESPVSSTNGHKRGKSDNPFRRSLLSDPSYLHGGSRIHLLSNYDSRDETRRQVSGVQTDYFRLKARGITTLPNGTPLASSAAKNVLHQKRSSDGITKPATPKSLMAPPAARSLPPKPIADLGGLRRGTTSSEIIQAMKSRAKVLVDEDQESRQKKRTFDDEDELFARAKRVREQMDEGQKWYKKQIESDTASRSVS